MDLFFQPCLIQCTQELCSHITVNLYIFLQERANTCSLWIKLETSTWINVNLYHMFNWTWVDQVCQVSSFGRRCPAPGWPFSLLLSWLMGEKWEGKWDNKIIGTWTTWGCHSCYSQWCQCVQLCRYATGKEDPPPLVSLPLAASFVASAVK